MSQNALSKRVISEIIHQLDAGSNISWSKRKVNIVPFLSSELAEAFNPEAAVAVSKRIIRYLRQQQLISLHERPRGRVQIRLTRQGMRRAQKISLNQLMIPRPRQWDRKWRVVIFDIPETQRQSRNRLILKLKQMGFYQLQRSFWVHPYPCHIEIEYLKRAYKISPYVCLAEISKIDKHNQLLQHFRRLVPQRRMS